ncbi:MAG: methionine adenosyltransferase [Caldiserica bacterium CG02_land_8_20_14_3_00_36_38]|nr:methionine adenosyltransferase [Caldisericota bacterium]OIP12157.1 MAG: methionine adenosyltransferase [Caldisericum sp. CG2_30_36_11]PIP49915.1 MAG: methionine adenosyltransferase [Caldiserica bacterium CG23_combo_of_CG06-09_8_20_14_all_35_60]PIV55364.1 MAG: methionine adenosyltransferase [Caldiserica bacterium CG02_land_8_20_14_3_00_36_38]PIX29324.1 MAG: methionine adenosyltransferase [Caldiserica bacterium CG_4_8_14_3_um_filter_35_18]
MVKNERKRFVTTESVTEGHPDKLADQISDKVLDEILKNDIYGRVACETYVTHGLIIVGGEITTKAWVDITDIARNAIKDVGYTSPKYGFDYRTCAVLNAVGRQSPDIAQGVDRGGAGDQGVMYGYATDETPELMPLPIVIAHNLTRQLAKVRKSGKPEDLSPFLGPDGKAQVTLKYEEDKAIEITDVIISTQHTEELLDPKDQSHMSDNARQRIIEEIAKPVLPSSLITNKTKFHINPTGKFVIGGPQSDTGMTGRKLEVDTYGGMVPHGGGALSGKDPSKVDRSASYMMRYLAKNVVASGIAKECLIQIAYVIGEAMPISFMVDTFGTGKARDEEIEKTLLEIVDLTPAGMIKKLDLLRPIYQKTASYGHFGREEKEFTWEKTDLKEEILKKLE